MRTGKHRFGFVQLPKRVKPQTVKSRPVLIANNGNLFESLHPVDKPVDERSPHQFKSWSPLNLGGRVDMGQIPEGAIV